MTTPHINAKSGDFAKTVLFPGDPLRAKFIAEKFLKDYKEVTNVRNMLGFTGYYNDVRVSVMGSGMGIPSCTIYAKELITEYGVENIIRVGSAGGLGSNIKVRDIVLAQGASTDSGFNRARFNGCDFAAIADFNLLQTAYNAAQKNDIAVKVGNCFSTDVFYNPNPSMFSIAEKMKILCVEMEAAGLYGVAAELGAKALAILTISDHINTHESLESNLRETTFIDMMKIALETAIA